MTKYNFLNMQYPVHNHSHMDIFSQSSDFSLNLKRKPMMHEPRVSQW